MHMQRTLLHCKKMSEHEVFKKFGRNIGRLKLSAVRLYAKQLLIYLKHPKNCAVLYCDIKPGNMFTFFSS